MEANPDVPVLPAYLSFLTTPHEWEDPILASSTREDLEDIVTWTQTNPALKPGVWCLFLGPSADVATGAALLGKRLGVPAFRVGLSGVTSKYIGETEKNLGQIFDRVQGLGAILFFDEADALFGKRTEVQDAHDRYSHEQISYLLQRMEEFRGIMIAGVDSGKHLDEAFARRFPYVVHFPRPDA